MKGILKFMMQLTFKLLLSQRGMLFSGQGIATHLMQMQLGNQTK